MSRLDLTTHQLFLKLGQTARSRSTRADALFRRLRRAEQEKLSQALTAAPKRVDADTVHGKTKAAKISE
ncbi:MAG: hypothetical protein ACE5FO_05025 [Parvularculaceae bacterium]